MLKDALCLAVRYFFSLANLVDLQKFASTCCQRKEADSVKGGCFASMQNPVSGKWLGLISIFASSVLFLDCHQGREMSSFGCSLATLNFFCFSNGTVELCPMQTKTLSKGKFLWPIMHFVTLPELNFLNMAQRLICRTDWFMIARCAAFCFRCHVSVLPRQTLLREYFCAVLVSFPRKKVKK